MKMMELIRIQLKLMKVKILTLGAGKCDVYTQEARVPMLIQK
jgi:hypothetical protein